MTANIKPNGENQKRYIVTISYYLLADDDSAALKAAMVHTSNLNKTQDAKATVDGLVEQPFGQASTRQII